MATAAGVLISREVIQQRESEDRSKCCSKNINFLLPNASICGNIFLFGSFRMKFKICRPVIWLHGQAVKTSPFHGGNTGSIPVGVIFMYGAIAKW